jgi:hypothetical protein
MSWPKNYQEEMERERGRINWQELSLLREALFTRHPIKFWEKVAPFLKRIETTFPDDFLDYRAYHILKGTIAEPSFPLKEEDFPGNLSVEEFLRKIQQDLSELS